MKHQAIADALFESIEREANKNNTRRTYLGMSGFNTHCDRKQWLEFRHGFTPFINYQSATHFEDGHKSEDILVDRLIKSGFELEPVDTDGKQFAYVDGWLKGHSDGKCRINGELYVWEAKATNDDKKGKLRKLIETDEHAALEKWDANYYAQAQLYMHYSGIKKHVLFATSHGSREKKNSKGDHRTVIVETLYNEAFATDLVNKAKDIIATDRLPEAPYTLAIKRPLCWWGEETYQQCEAYNFCTGKDIGEPDCFNCGHASFLESGVGLCNNTGHEMLPSEMAEYKPCHKYSPEFVVGYDAIEMREDGSVLYRNNAGDEIINEDSLEFRKKIRGE